MIKFLVRAQQNVLYYWHQIIVVINASIPKVPRRILQSQAPFVAYHGHLSFQQVYSAYRSMLPTHHRNACPTHCVSSRHSLTSNCFVTYHSVEHSVLVVHISLNVHRNLTIYIRTRSHYYRSIPKQRTSFIRAAGARNPSTAA